MQPYQAPESFDDSKQEPCGGPPLGEVPQIFAVKSGTHIWGWLMLAGGCFTAVVALCGFLLQVFLIDGDSLSLTMTSTIPSLLAFGMITTAVRMLKSPRAIEITDQGLLQHPGKMVLWSEIALALSGEEYPASKSLTLLGANGKSLAKLNDSIENCEQLFAFIQQRVKQESDPDLAERLRLKKARKTAVMCFAGSLVLAVISVFLLFSTYESQQKQHRLETAVVEGEAIVQEKFLAPNGHTTRIHFSFGPEADAEVHNVEVEKELYPFLEEGQVIAVRYDPEDPGNVELLAGQVKSNKISPVQEYLLAGGALLVSPIVFALGVMFWKGRELKADQKGIRLVRSGEE